MNVTIRQAKLYDVPAMARIERDSFEAPWSADEITKDVTAGGNVYVAVAEAGDETAGFEKAGYAEIRASGMMKESRSAAPCSHRGVSCGQRRRGSECEQRRWRSSQQEMTAGMEAFNNDLVIRYLDKVVVKEDGYEVAFNNQLMSTERLTSQRFDVTQ